MTTDERFDRIEQLIEKMVQRFDAVDRRFDRVDQRFDRVDHSIEALTQRVTRVEESGQNLNRYFLDFRSEVLSRFQAIEARMDVPVSIATTLNNQMSALTKAVADLGAVHTQLSAAQWKHTDSTFDLERRVSKLEEIISKLKPAA